MAGEQSSFRRTVMRIAAVVLLLITGVLLVQRLWGGGDDDDDRPLAGGGDQTPPDPVTEEVTTTLTDPGVPIEPTCPAPDGSSPRQVNFSVDGQAGPPTCIDPAVTYVAVVETNRGDIEITLDAEAAPLAVNNFVFLARWHFYDGVGFHRVIPGFVAQAGDPVGPEVGVGGPGYEFTDELPAGEPPLYPLMSVAMANAGPNTNGSQFFIVTGPEGEQLPGLYTRFGGVTAGTPVVEDIDATGAPDRSGTPTELTVIEQVTIEER
ncbi:MAG: peptidylprolyl isomerase [Acidimicrobiales bacterium]